MDRDVQLKGDPPKYRLTPPKRNLRKPVGIEYFVIGNDRNVPSNRQTCRRIGRLADAPPKAKQGSVSHEEEQAFRMKREKEGAP